VAAAVAEGGAGAEGDAGGEEFGGVFDGLGAEGDAVAPGGELDGDTVDEVTGQPGGAGEALSEKDDVHGGVYRGGGGRVWGCGCGQALTRWPRTWL